jgi:hypothetical protein
MANQACSTGIAMTDKELLELAAKASGMEPPLFWEDGKPIYPWNPLTNDGDALRLAVKLSMKVYVGEAYPWDKDCADYSHRFGACVDEDENNDPYAATRRAIVRAAAEIGKTL